MEKYRNLYLSLVVPVYKQENTVVAHIVRLKKALDKEKIDYEIIAVIDGLVDRTLENLTKAKLPRVKCLKYKVNRGKWYALKMGMMRARGDYVMFMDCGLEINPKSIFMLIEYLNWYNADIIVGSKRHPASIVYYPLVRKILSFGYFTMVKLLFGLNIKDTQAGIKIIRKQALVKVLPKLLEKKFAGDLEMLVVANYLGYTKIYEAPIQLDYRLGGITSAATLRSIWGIILDTFAIFYRLKITNYYKS